MSPLDTIKEQYTWDQRGILETRSPLDTIKEQYT
jgi:hypothetical protein